MALDEIDVAVTELEAADAVAVTDPNEDPDGRYVEWTQKDGQVVRWRLADETGILPLMMFAKHANAGMDSNDLDALEVMFQLLQDCIHPEVFRRFMQWGTQQKLQGDDVFAIVEAAWAVISGNPTESPTGSPPGSSTTSPSSNGTSGNRASRRKQGREARPDPNAALKKELGIVPIDQDLARAR